MCEWLYRPRARLREDDLADRAGVDERARVLDGGEEARPHPLLRRAGSGMNMVMVATVTTVTMI
jgi:hypothetical protein